MEIQVKVIKFEDVPISGYYLYETRLLKKTDDNVGRVVCHMSSVSENWLDLKEDEAWGVEMYPDDEVVHLFFK